MQTDQQFNLGEIIFIFCLKEFSKENLEFQNYKFIAKSSFQFIVNSFDFICSGFIFYVKTRTRRTQLKYSKQFYYLKGLSRGFLFHNKENSQSMVEYLSFLIETGYLH